MPQMTYEHCLVTDTFAATIGARVYMNITPSSAVRVQAYILRHFRNIKVISLKANYYGLQSANESN